MWSVITMERSWLLSAAMLRQVVCFKATCPCTPQPWVCPTDCLFLCFSLHLLDEISILFVVCQYFVNKES